MALFRLRAHVCALLSVALLALAASPALADGTDPDYPGSVLHVTTTGSDIAGKLLTIVATGTNAPSSVVPIDYGLRLFAIDHKLLPEPCSQSLKTEETISSDNPQASRLPTFEDLNEGLSGPFTISLPLTPGGPGDLLICAYSVLVTDDAAWASTQVTIVKAGHGRPSVTARPRITRSGDELRCSRGTWSGKPRSFSYRWLVLQKPGTAGHGPSLKLSPKLHGRTVEWAVTAKNPAGSATATSRSFKIA
jgi:hypothetical protein